MATAAVILTKPVTFVYEDLISHVENIQKELTQMEQILDQKCQTERKVTAELKSRSFNFIDPYGNRIIVKHFDHHSMEKILRRYKKDYVPKYLHQWIKIGNLNENQILPLTDCELKSSVSKYDDGHQFVAYVEVVVWIRTSEDENSFFDIVISFLLINKILLQREVSY